MTGPRHYRRHPTGCAQREESDRLRQPFLRWIGKRSSGAGLKAAGIDYAHGIAWLGGRAVLHPHYQTIVRRLLDESGIEASPCG